MPTDYLRSALALNLEPSIGKIESIDCRICGGAIEQSQGRGRPREYHPQCKEISDALGVLERELPTLREGLPAEYRRRLKSRLFTLQNRLNPAGGFKKGTK